MSKVNSVPSVRGLFFFDQNKGWVCGNFLYKTENAGLSFPQISNTGVNAAYAIQFTDNLHGWLAGGTNLYRTVDGGATLEMLISSSNFGDIHFFDNNNGFILSGNKIYSTGDGGKTLNQLATVHKAQLIEFHFTDPNHGWATGGGGYVYRYVKP